MFRGFSSKRKTGRTRSSNGFTMSKSAKPAKLLCFLGSHFGVSLLKKMEKRKDLEFHVVTFPGLGDRYYGYDGVIEYCRRKGLDCWNSATADDGAVFRFAQTRRPALILCGYYARL